MVNLEDLLRKIEQLERRLDDCGCSGYEMPPRKMSYKGISLNNMCIALRLRDRSRVIRSGKETRDLFAEAAKACSREVDFMREEEKKTLAKKYIAMIESDLELGEEYMEPDEIRSMTYKIRAVREKYKLGNYTTRLP